MSGRLVHSSEDTVVFGSLLRRYRMAAGFSQAMLAERADLSIDAVSALERGRRAAPRMETVARLAAGLGLNMADRSVLIAAAVGVAVADRPPPSPAAVQATAPLQRSTLPMPITALMGREREEADLLRLLRRPEEPGGARLISLLGPGGVGKSRLALAVAAAACSTFTDGVVFVDLSALHDPALVLLTIAQALDLREAGGKSPAEQLTDYLRARHMLLVLDNVEQVVEAAPQIALLVAASPRLRVLATSRTALHVRAEQRFAVPLLATPPAERLVTAEDLASYAAVRLFVERAQAVAPHFRLDDSNASAVAAICTRLDGLPLAIELAAARVSFLPPQALLAQLERSPTPHRILAAGTRDLPVRQQTLRATFEWSFGLLTAGEQMLLRRLAIFVAGCTLESASTVCLTGETTAGSPLDDVLDGMASLVDKSLVQVTVVDGTEARFGMLETIREYARERLQESGEQATLERAHAAFYQALAEEAEPALTGPEQEIWLARLEREQHNLRAALHWAHDNGQTARGLHLAVALWRFWYARGHFSEGRAWLEGLLDQAERSSESVPAPAVQRAYMLAGVLATIQGDYDRAAGHCEASLALSRGLGDRPGIAIALNTLGNLAMNHGRYDRALSLSEESLALQRELGNKRMIASALNNLGFVVLQLGDYARASSLCEESLTLARDLRDNLGMGYALSNLGDVAREQGEYGRALAFYGEGLPLCRSIGSTDGVAGCLEGIAVVAEALAEHRRAARLCAAAASMRNTIGAALQAASQAAYDRTVTAARAALGDQMFEQAWAEGRALSEEQIVEEVHALAPPRAGGLTRI